MLLQKGQISLLKKESLSKSSIPSFKPQINPHSKITLNDCDKKTVFQRLFSPTTIVKKEENLKENKNNNQKKKTKQNTQKKISNEIEKENRFVTYLTNSEFAYEAENNLIVKTKNNSKNNNIERNNVSKLQTSFNKNSLSKKKKVYSIDNDLMFEKNNYWLIQKEHKLEKIRNEKKENELEGCTFKPIISKKSFDNKVAPIFSKPIFYDLSILRPISLIEVFKGSFTTFNFPSH